MSDTITAPERTTRLPVAIPVAIAVAWVVAIAAEATGHAGALHHHSLLSESGPVWLVIVLAGLAWLLHVAAIMLPSSLPMVRHFGAVSAAQPHPKRALGSFVGGYAVMWLAFGLVALGLDAILHRMAHRVEVLHQYPWLPAVGVLAAAGAFQFSSLKDRCLDACRHPAAFLLPRYRRGSTAALRLGLAHGLFCIGCCWALMLVMFAVGLVDLRWMAGIGAVMIYEKVGRHGRRLTPVVGAALLGLAVVVLFQPSWLPAALLGPG